MSKILVGADGSERSLDAAAFAHRLARASGAEVVVAAVFPYDDRPSRMSNRAFRQELQLDAHKVAVEVADAFADLGPDRVHVVTAARTSVAHGLQDVAADQGAELIVVGSSHTGRVGRVLPGSTAERLLHGAPCPVAVVPKGYREQDAGLRVVGVAYDGSSEAAAALHAAEQLATAASATLRVIRVVEIAQYSSPAMLGLGAGAYAAGLEEMHAAARKELDDAVGALPSALRAEALMLSGDPETEIAEQTGALDLFVTGSRGYGPLRAVMLGGFSGRLVRDAECPVLVVPRGIEAPLSSLFSAAPATA